MSNLVSKHAIISGFAGGFIVAIASIFIEDIGVIRTYWILFDKFGYWAFIGLIIRIVSFMLLGGFWAWMMKEPNGFKAFQLAIAAPVTLAAILGLKSDAGIKEIIIDETNSERIQKFDYLWAGVTARPLSVQGLDRLIKNSNLNETNTTETEQFTQNEISIIAQSFIDKFGGVERRDASDALSAYYNETNENSQKIIVKTLLINARTGGSAAYRINIYILRTLSRFDKWQCPDEEFCALFENMKKLTGDVTYQENFTNALAKSK
jgi:hypothetical protein